MADDHVCDYANCEHTAVWLVTSDHGSLSLCGGHYQELVESLEGCTTQRIDD